MSKREIARQIVDLAGLKYRTNSHKYYLPRITYDALLYAVLNLRNDFSYIIFTAKLTVSVIIKLVHTLPYTYNNFN